MLLWQRQYRRHGDQPHQDTCGNSAVSSFSDHWNPNSLCVIRARMESMAGRERLSRRLLSY